MYVHLAMTSAFVADVLVFISDDSDMTAVAVPRGRHHKLIGDDAVSQ